MRILIIGGTGTIGQMLVSRLLNSDDEVWVISRKTSKEESNIKFIQGDAKNISFLKNILSIKWDVIIDFLYYNILEFRCNLKYFLNNTEHYIFLSSCRVYSSSENCISEDYHRLADEKSIFDSMGMTDYAIEKALQENELLNSNYKNWTIVRPYITYSNVRLQLGIYEKENWLRRLIHNQPVIIHPLLLEKTTTLTSSSDVAFILWKIMKHGATADVFNTVSEESLSWREILEIYCDTFIGHVGLEPNFLVKDVDLGFGDLVHNQFKYDRMFHRKFSIAKLKNLIGDIHFKSMHTGLRESMLFILKNENFNAINWHTEGKIDKSIGNHTRLSRVHGKKNKIIYLKSRYF